MITTLRSDISIRISTLQHHQPINVPHQGRTLVSIHSNSIKLWIWHVSYWWSTSDALIVLILNTLYQQQGMCCLCAILMIKIWLNAKLCISHFLIGWLTSGQSLVFSKTASSCFLGLCYTVVIIPNVYLVPEAKPMDTNVPRVLLLLVNNSPNLLVPKAKPRNTNNIFYYYFYSANMPYHLLMRFIIF